MIRGYDDLVPGAVLPVAAFNRLVRDLLESALPLLWVRGEVSNLVRAASGHCYFSLKDANAQVRCVLFRHKARLLDGGLVNGAQVEVRAVATLYEARGDFQLSVDTVRRAGVGSLYEAFERLKARLGAEGLFEAALKRAVPSFARTVGVVTSPAGAALRDVVTVLRRRMPGIAVVVYPTPVQGATAPAAIVAALETAFARAECDVLIVCRGGGSLEDLWAFNDEAVARAIRRSPVPVVTGVGHETDFTIADFVADLRAPTPSAAAEAASPDSGELRRRLAVLGDCLARCGWRALEARTQRLDALARRLVDPRERLRQQARHLGHLAARLSGAMRRRLDAGQWHAGGLARRLRAAAPDPAAAAVRLDALRSRLGAAGDRRLEAGGAALRTLHARLEALNPDAVLARGYAIATAPDGTIVRDADALAAGDSLHVRFWRGAAHARVERLDADGFVPAADDQSKGRR